MRHRLKEFSNYFKVQDYFVGVFSLTLKVLASLVGDVDGLQVQFRVTKSKVVDEKMTYLSTYVLKRFKTSWVLSRWA